MLYDATLIFINKLDARSIKEKMEQRFAKINLIYVYNLFNSVSTVFPLETYLNKMTCKEGPELCEFM